MPVDRQYCGVSLHLTSVVAVPWIPPWSCLSNMREEPKKEGICNTGFRNACLACVTVSWVVETGQG